jgi:hypothetical protein
MEWRGKSYARITNLLPPPKAGPAANFLGPLSLPFTNVCAQGGQHKGSKALKMRMAKNSFFTGKEDRISGLR